jgi:hypothetical protein
VTGARAFGGARSGEPSLAAATKIMLICAGWLPHENDPSGAASD